MGLLGSYSLVSIAPPRPGLLPNNEVNPPNDGANPTDVPSVGKGSVIRVARVQPPGKMPGRRRWLVRLLGACLTAAVVGWPAALASAATNDPPIPGGLRVTAEGSSQISLSWILVETDGWQASGYNVYMGTSPGGEPPVGGSSSPSSSTSYTATGLASGTTYYFKVSAVYPPFCIDPCTPGTPDIESAQSMEVSAATRPVPPGPPTGLTATAAGNSRINLSWTAPATTAGATVTGYKMYDGTSSGGESLGRQLQRHQRHGDRSEQRDQVLLRSNRGLSELY